MRFPRLYRSRHHTRIMGGRGCQREEPAPRSARGSLFRGASPSALAIIGGGPVSRPKSRAPAPSVCPDQKGASAKPHAGPLLSTGMTVRARPQLSQDWARRRGNPHSQGGLWTCLSERARPKRTVPKGFDRRCLPFRATCAVASYLIKHHCVFPVVETRFTDNSSSAATNRRQLGTGSARCRPTRVRAGSLWA